MTVEHSARPLARASIESVQMRDWALKNHGYKYPARVKKWMRLQPCIVCQGRADDLHHIFGSVGSLKSADVFTVPVCRSCHTLNENKPEFRDICMIEWMKLIARCLSSGLVW